MPSGSRSKVRVAVMVRKQVVVTELLCCGMGARAGAAECKDTDHASGKGAQCNPLLSTEATVKQHHGANGCPPDLGLIEQHAERRVRVTRALVEDVGVAKVGCGGAHTGRGECCGLTESSRA